MPASPESKTIWPAPAQASRRRSCNRALSAARPTRSVSPRHRCFYFEPGPHRPLGVVLMRPRIAEIDQHPVAHEFGDKSVIAHDGAGNGVLTGPESPAQFLGVKSPSHPRGAEKSEKNPLYLPPSGAVRRLR